MPIVLQALMWFMMAAGFMGIIAGGFLTLMTLLPILGGSWEEGGLPFIYGVVAGIFIIVCSHQVRRMAGRLGEGNEQARYVFSTLTGLACIGFALVSMGNVLFLSGVPVFLVFTWSLNTAAARAWCSGEPRERPQPTPRVAGCLLLILSVPIILSVCFEHLNIGIFRRQPVFYDAPRACSKQEIDKLVGALTRYNAMEPHRAAKLEELKGKYIRRVPADPWGKPYYLDTVEGVIGTCGADGKQGTDDDIVISYLPDPLLMDVQFRDSGVVPVCLPDERGFLMHGDEWRHGTNGAPNQGLPGPGDVIELIFTRPVWYGYDPWDPVSTTYPVAVINPSTGETLPAEADLTGKATIDDFVITNRPVSAAMEDGYIPEECFPYLFGFDVYSMYRMDLDTEQGQYPHIIYIPWGEPETVRIVLGDVQTIGDSDGDGTMEPLTIITPGEMYLNLDEYNNFIDRSRDMNPMLPASRPMLIKYPSNRTKGK